MLKRYYTWYNILTPLTQLAVSYTFNWFIWLFGWMLGDKIFFDQPHSWKVNIFNATFMAFVNTIFYNWSKLKTLFKNDNNKDAVGRARN